VDAGPAGSSPFEEFSGILYGIRHTQASDPVDGACLLRIPGHYAD
jgi:hypothetical protein